MNVVAGVQSAVQGNNLELIPTVKMESQHSVEGSFGREFSSLYIVRDYSHLKSQAIEEFCPKFAFFEKKDPLREDFQNFVPKKGFIISQIHVVCVNFEKFGRSKVGEIMRCLPELLT